MTLVFVIMNIIQVPRVTKVNMRKHLKAFILSQGKIVDLFFILTVSE